MQTEVQAEEKSPLADFVSGPDVRMSPGFERIIDKVFTVDELSEFEELEGRLRLGVAAHRADYAVLIDALEESEDCARRAHRLYVNAYVAHEGFEIDAKVVDGGMRERAVADLQAEKESGVRHKQITEADVAAAIAARFPDEYRDLEIRRSKAKRMRDHLGQLAELWVQRCRTLETLVGKQRR